MVTNKECKCYAFCKFQENSLYGLNGVRAERGCDGCKFFKSIHPEPPYLKPCPFCGGEAEIKRGTACSGHGDYGPEKWVQCTECGARTQKYLCDGYYGCEMTDEELAEKWNTRI